MIYFREKLDSIEKKHGIHIEYLMETTSTNDVAAEERFESGDIVIAEYQTKGRGQRGHSWHSKTGENLTFTLVLKPEDMLVDKQFYISKMIPLALVRTFARFDIRAEIKWTNDVYVGDRKIVGILIENDIMGDRITKSIAGIGINVNQKTFDPALPNPVSMSVITGKKYDRAQVLDCFITEVSILLDKLKSRKFDELDAEYHCNLYRRKGSYPFADPDGQLFNASIERVHETGELILRHESSGEVKSYLFTEVEFVIKNR